jgi:SAM-dependent methyltransferase
VALALGTSDPVLSGFRESSRGLPGTDHGARSLSKRERPTAQTLAPMKSGHLAGPRSDKLPSGSVMAVLLPEAEEHYRAIDEARRLERLGSQIELVRTQEILLRFLGQGPRRILDVGGGAGVYSFWLADRGHDVTLIDAVQKHIDQAMVVNSAREFKLAAARVGDARSLGEPDEAFDAVLLLGPLYHLTRRADREAALNEALRVLKPGGFLFAVAISRFASTVNLLLSGNLGDENFAGIASRDRRTGEHRNPTGDPAFFTTSHWHHPEELRHEIESCGFHVARLLAVEGPARLMHEYERNWLDTSSRETLLQIVRDLEDEPSLLGLSIHILAVARRV